MKASLQSFGGKARIENVISISYFSLIFSIKAMLAHGWPNSMQFICSLIHLPRDFVLVCVWMGGMDWIHILPCLCNTDMGGHTAMLLSGLSKGNEVRDLILYSL